MCVVCTFFYIAFTYLLCENLTHTHTDVPSVKNTVSRVNCRDKKTNINIGPEILCFQIMYVEIFLPDFCTNSKIRL